MSKCVADGVRGEVVVGIDVGGHRKGFHAVALRGCEVIDRLASPDPRAIADWCRAGADVPGPMVIKGLANYMAIRAATTRATQPFDYVLSPVSPVPTYPAEWEMPSNDVNRAMEHISFTMPYNMSEQPAASINCGYTAEGKPLGLQIAGRRFDDLGVLRVSRWYESARGPQKPWPTPPR